MAKYRFIHVSFWEDARVLEDMTPEDKYFYMYLLTNPSTTQIGIYQITKKKIAFETGYSIETVNALMDRFENIHKLIKYNAETRELVILNWAKYNLNKGGKPMLDCVRVELAEIKDKNLLAMVIDSVPNKDIKAVFHEYMPSKEVVEGVLEEVKDDTSHDTLDDTSTTRGQKEKEKEKEKEKKNIDHEQEDLAQQFSELWNLYPNKKGRTAAFKSFKKAIKHGTPFETIKNGVLAYLEYCRANNSWYKPAHGSTWFNGERWDDDFSVEIGGRQGGLNTRSPAKEYSDGLHF